MSASWSRGRPFARPATWRRARGVIGHAALLVATACTAAPASSTSDAAGSTHQAIDEPPPAAAAGPTASAAEGGGPIPARVADLHRTIFDRSAKPTPGGAVRCLITVHDGQLSHDRFYAVALFADGSVATWTQAPEGAVEPFLAKLTPEEGARARPWVEALAHRNGATTERFGPSTTVMGFSARSGDRVETSYFASGQTPEPLDRLVQLLKGRLEATNAR